MTHTPGPWHIEGQDTFTPSICTERGFNLTTIAHIENQEHRGRQPRETLGNAHLLAGAPDLKKALKRLEQVVLAAAIFPNSDDLLEAGAALKEARVALLKSEGIEATNEKEE